MKMWCSFRNKRNQYIACYRWKPSGEPRALLLISHGMTEHSMRYDALARKMAQRGYFVFAHDHIGHGYSEGKRGFINDVHELVDDTIMHVQSIRKEYPELPLFLFGHSMGGSICIFLCVEPTIQVDGMALIAPGLASNPETASYFLVKIAKLVSMFLPSFPLGTPDFNLATRNALHLEEISKDQLIYRGYWHARTIISLLEVPKELMSKALEIKVPFLILHGDEDKVCHVDGSKTFYELSGSSDKTLKIYPRGYHSLHNEPDGMGEAVWEAIVEWLEKKVED